MAPVYMAQRVDLKKLGGSLGVVEGWLFLGVLNWVKLRARIIAMVGLPSTIRTCDLRLRRAVLYPAELWAVFAKALIITEVQKTWLIYDNGLY
jgi:hypothetical protein